MASHWTGGEGNETEYETKLIRKKGSCGKELDRREEEKGRNEQTQRSADWERRRNDGPISMWRRTKIIAADD